MVLRVMYVIELLESEEGGIELVDPAWCPEEGPPRKKVKSPPAISPTGSSTSIYSGGSSSIEWTTTGTSLEMQGTRVTRTQYGFRTLQESSAKMCLKVTGFPLPDITWYKDGVLLKEDERHTFYSDEDGFFALTIDPVQVEDTGRYSCQATNEYGQASTSAFFRVIKVEKESAPPSFLSTLSDKSTKEGEVVTFECEVDGWPEPELLWLVDEQPLRPSADFRIQYDGQKARLEIRDAQPDDTGTYAVKITNEYGTVESKCHLNVAPDPDKNHVPPEFQATIEDVECNEGDTVKFKAVLTGDPQPDVVWYINGVPLTASEKIKFINEDGICLLTIKDISRHFDGTVTCQGKNRLGSGSCEARLRVRVPPVPPQFEQALEDRMCTENGTCTFDVDVIGWPDPKLEFFLRGRALVHGQDGVDIRQIVEGHYRLTISNCQIDAHDGEVLARATNEHGQAESRARLTIEPEEEESRSAPTFIKDIEDQTVKQGEHAMFDTVVRGSPRPSVSWWLNGQRLEESTPGVVAIQQSEEGAVHKIVLDSNQCMGTVLCRAENPIGRFETKACMVVTPAEKQKKAPVFRQPLSDNMATEGASVVFEVTVEAEPPAQFRWSLNGVVLTESSRINLREFEGSSKLELSECRLEDAGQIECTATNSEGQAQTSARFNVQRRPKAPQINQRPGTVQVEKGEQAVFVVSADAMPPPEFTWTVGGRRVFASTEGARVEGDDTACTSRLFLDTHKFGESAPVLISAENRYGRDECSARLIVVEPLPAPPTKKGRFSDEEESTTESTQITQLQQNVQLSSQNAVEMAAQQQNVPDQIVPMDGVQFQQQTPETNVLFAGEAKQKPSFKKPLEQCVECKADEPIVLEVQVDSANKMHWFINDEPLENGKNGIRIEERLEESEGYSRLIIDNVRPDCVNIRVEAENEAGKIESQCQMHVAPTSSSGPSAPRIVQQLSQTINVKEGESFELLAVITGNPVPTVKWLLNDEVVGEQGDENVQITSTPGGQQTLRVQASSAARHNGRVVLQAENGEGCAESQAQVTVEARPGPPYFTREPQDHAVCDDVDSVKFSAIVHGNPTPSVHWFLKGETLIPSEHVRVKHEPLTGKTSIRLMHPSCEQSGAVEVRAENVHGRAEAGAKLAVEKKAELPRFNTELVDRQVTEGDNVRYIARIEAQPEPEVQWTLNGELLVNADNVKIGAQGGVHTLELSDVRTDQAGEIACTARNAAGSKRQNAQLAVKEHGQAPTWVRHLEDRLVEENQTLAMEAQLAPGCKPKPEVHWLKDGQPLVSNERVKLSEAMQGEVHRLTIVRAEMGDKGKITLQAENKFGTTESSASVGVKKRMAQKKPEFLSELGPLIVTEGDSLNARVLISGDPTPYTKWYINNQMVYQTEDVEMTAQGGVYKLVIHGCTRDMSGKIKCVAGNRMGEASIEGQLTVTAPVPVEFETALCDATCREGDTLKLKAVLLGEPMPDVTWFINGKKLEESQNIKIHADQGTYTVTIKDITMDYAGLVVCEAVNEYGKASSQATLKVLPRGEPPDFLEWLSNVRARQGSQVQHKVVYTGDPRPLITWYINGQVVRDSETISIQTDEKTSVLTIRSFDAVRHVGEIICKAENDAGEVSCTANMATYTSDMFTESDSQAEEQQDDFLDAEKETFRTPTPIMAPAFITKIKDTRAQRGHQAIFECVVPDTKGVCCKWLKDGKEIELIARIRVQLQTIEGFTTSELVIDQVEPEDAGKYTVVVETVAGAAQCEAELVVVETLDKPVEKAPEFIVQLQDKVVHESDRCSFECKVSALPEATISWYRGEQLLVEEMHKVRIESSSGGVQRLIIDSAEMTHEGQYRCVAQNHVGSAQTAANLRVETAAPEFTRPLSDQEVQLGGQVVFECSVKGIPQPLVEFFTAHDNFRLQTSTRVSIQHDVSNTHWRMVISNVVEQDMRTYRAVAKNSVGQAISEAKLTRKQDEVERPRILEGLKRQKVKEGETVEMGVKVAGAGRPGEQPPEVEWFKNGEPLMPEDRTRVELVEYRDSGEYKLIIRDARAEDSGDYGVRISNKAGADTSHAQLVVECEELARPEFVQPLRDVHIQERESVTLKTVVTGKPDPEVQWLKEDGTPVNVDGTHIVRKDEADGVHCLTIIDASLDDARTYICKAVNKAGEVECKGAVNVEPEATKPAFTRPLQDVNITEGQSATLETQVTGKPEPKVQWMKDGTPVREDDTHIVRKDEDGRHTLTISQARLEDAGTYTCKAVNSAGEAESTARLAVQEDTQKPEFMQPLRDTTIREQENVTLSAVVTGKPEPQVQWLKDGVPVQVDGTHIARRDEEGGHHSLTINQARLDDAGLFTCKAVNKAGEAESKARLGVQEDVEKPHFVEELQPAQLKEGETGTLSAVVRGKPEPQIQWLKDGAPLHVDGQHVVQRREEGGRHTLIVSEAALSDAGTYSCVATNKVGEARSEARLAVQQMLEAPKFVEGLKPVEVREGETGTLSVVVTGRPEPELQWYKDGYPVEIDGLHNVLRNDGGGRHTLAIKEAHKRDTGSYTVQAKNKAGQCVTQAKFGVIEDVEAPKFTQGLQPVEVKEGETAKMSVAVEGKPHPEVHWFKDGAPIQIDGQHVVRKDEGHGYHSLTINQARCGDAGHYSCKAVNKAGEAHTEAHFGVQEQLEAPRFTQPLRDADVQKPGERVQLECTVVGKPEPEIVWKHDGQPLNLDGIHAVTKKESEGRHTLVINNAEKADAGTYSCEATNKAGHDQTNAELKFAQQVEEEQKPPEQVQLSFLRPLESQTVLPGEPAEMSCQLSTQPDQSKPQVQWYKDDVPIQPSANLLIECYPDGTQKLLILCANPEDIGTYRCEAVNPIGKAQTSAHLKYAEQRPIEQVPQEQVVPQLAQPQFIRPLEPKTVREGESAEMECRVNAAESRPDIRWYRDDILIEPGREPNLVIEQRADGTQKLRILYAKPEDQGVYRCEATNLVGKAQTSAPLKYAEERQIQQPSTEEMLNWMHPLRDKEVPRGTTNLVMECQLEPKCLPKVIRVDWLKDGAIVANKLEQLHLRVEQRTDGTQRLVFEQAEFEHIGVYRCVATDQSGSQIWTEARLGVIAPRDTSEIAPGPPEFVELLKSCTTTIGGTAVLRCKVRGNPRPTIVWSRQGYGPITMSERMNLEYHEDGTIILTLKDADMEDTGEYRCDAENEYGTAWTEGPIIVAAEGSLPTEGEAPDFVEPVRPITVRQGETGVLEGKITGLPFPEVKWYKGEELIVPGQNPRYHIEGLPDGTQRLIVSNAQMSDMDDYRCEASNKYGDVWSDVTMTVQLPSEEVSFEEPIHAPTFVRGLHEIKAPEGEPAVFECVVKGFPKPDIKWFKDGQEVRPDDARLKIESFPDGTQRLTIPTTRITDAGVFRCEASNSAGQARTEAPLRVLLKEEEGAEPLPAERAPEFLKQLQPVEAKEGEQAAFECKVSALPSPDIRWYKDGNELTPADGFRIECLPDGTQRLVIPSAKLNDIGSYRCEARNPAGQARTEAPLNVARQVEEHVPEEVAPEFIEGLKPVEAKEGEQAAFECRLAPGQPKPEIKWYKDGHELKPADNVRIESLPDGTQRLTIPSTKLDDIGAYKCEAINPAGIASTKAPLNVAKQMEERVPEERAMELPEFVEGLKPVEAKEGEEAVFQCKLNPDATRPEVKWYKDGKELKPADGIKIESLPDGTQRLTVPKATLEDKGDYKCEATNPAGTAASEAPLNVAKQMEEHVLEEHVMELPAFAEGLKPVEAKEGDEAVFECRLASTEPQPDVKWYKDGQELKPADGVRIESLPDGTQRLTIPSTDLEDKGKYTCEARNPAGQARTEAPLNVAKQVEEHVPEEHMGPELAEEEIPVQMMAEEGLEERAMPEEKMVEQKAPEVRIDEQKPEADIKPEIVKGLLPTRVKAGEPATFEVQVRGPVRQVKWYKNGREMDNPQTEQSSDGTTFRLIIPNASSDDAADYKVVLSNDAGEADSSAPLTVIKPICFVRPLEDVTVPKGHRAVLNAETDRAPRLVKWFKNGEELKPGEAKAQPRSVSDTKFRLEIPDTDADDMANYSIKVFDSEDEPGVECACALTVLLPAEKVDQKPRFEQPLREQTIPEEAELILEVMTSGRPHTVKWFKNGQQLSPSAQHRMEKIGPDHFKLVVPNAQQSDSGVYACEIANDAGSARCEAKQTVEPVPEFVRPLQDVDVVEGEKAEFWCETNLRSVPHTIKWFCNGKELGADGRIEMRVEEDGKIFRLIFKSAQKEDAGTVRIMLENTAGKAESQAKLGVRPAIKKEAPKIVKALLDQIVAEGEELVFEVQVQGEVDEIRWLKDGAPIGKEARVKAEQIDAQTYRLTIPSALLSDAGEFEVQAINGVGKAVSNAHAEVDQAPHIVQGLVPAAIKEGDDHLFRVEVSAPVRQVKWFKNGQELQAPPGSRFKLIDVSPKKYELDISQAQLEDGANYKVVLSNRAGECDSSAELTVQRPAVFKLRKGLEDVTVDEGQPLELSAELEGVPTFVKWYKNGEEVVPDGVRVQLVANPDTGVYKLRIADALPSDGGAYRVVFANPAGGELSSGAVAHVKKRRPAEERKPAFFMSPLQDVTLKEGETLTLKCQVGGQPMPQQVRWFRRGEELRSDERVAIRLGLDGTATLRIHDVRIATDAGEFKAIAANEAGEAESTCQVTVIGAEALPCAPRFIIPLKRTEGTPGKPAVFSVKVRGIPMPKLQWLLNGHPIAFDGADAPRFQLEDMADGNWTMTINEVQESDFGTLRCIATNELGSDECEAPFEPSAEWLAAKREQEGWPPRFNVPLWDRRVPEGQLMSIECHVDAKPTAEIFWFWNGKPLEESPEIEIRNTPDGACRVKIKSFRSEHVGEFRCEAKNEYGVADTRANYNVEVEEPEEREEKKEYPPKFNPGLSDATLNAGDTLHLRCRVEAVPPASITFYKDGVPLIGSDRVHLDHNLDSGECTIVVDETRPEDAGAYRCVAQNVHGSTNTACQVNVRAKKEEAKKEGAEPCFTRGLVDQYVDRGETLIFTCAVTGDPEPEIKWFCNGKALKPSDRVQIEQLPGGECRLTIRDCAIADEGIYRCEAHNAHGTAKTQATAHIQVSVRLEKPKVEMGEAPKFIIPLEDCAVFVGSAIELECKCTGVPMPSVKWSKDGRPLIEDARFEWDNSPEQGHYRLRIREASRHDEGTYRCVAQNESGQASTKAFVRLDEGLETRAPPEATTPPRITVKLADVRVQEGQLLKLHCRVEGDPQPEIVWYKDGEQVRPSERVQLERDTDGNAYLIIPKCTMDDDGVYRVIATNPHGSAYDKCTATVKKAAPADEGAPPKEIAFDANKAPKLLEPLQNVKVPEGTEFVLRCKFSGDPMPTIKWYKDGERLFSYDHVQIVDITPDGWCELRVPEAERSDAGNYRCVAENPFGAARTACEVQVQREKKPKEDLLDKARETGRAPGFTIPLTMKRAKPGDTVTFECLPYGKPFPDIKWLKDGMELMPGEGLRIEADPDGTQRLIIDNVDFPAEGYYRCVATNEHGTASTRAELVVSGERPRRKVEEAEEPKESKPRIRPGLFNQSVHQGSPLEMQICALGFPTPSVEWLKDGKPIQAAGTPDSRITIHTDERGVHHLLIVNCQPEDEGDYSVVARNPLGEAISTGTLSVIRPRGVEGAEDEGRGGMPFPPGFIRQLKNKHVFSKMPTIFDCLVVGYPPPEVDWYHNVKKIVPGGRYKIQVAGGGSHALLITETAPEDAGEYVAIARNCHGTAQSSAILDVTVPMLDKIKFDGTLDVTPYLTEEYGFKKQQYKGIPTPPDRGPFIKEVTGHYLTLSWIPTKRSPPRYPQVTYVIEIRELPDKEWSLLDYNIPEPVCKVRNLELGKSYQFRVRAENIYGISDPSPPSPPSRLMAPPPPVLDKYKRVIPLLDPYAERALDLAHAEQYACTPWFAPGAQVKRFVAENDHASITLHYSGYPDPKITWKHRGHDIDTKHPTSNMRVSTHAGAETTLTFLGFLRSNVGQYTCVAENQYGKAEQNILVEIASRPKFIAGLSNRECSTDRPMRLDVRLEGCPVPEIKWLKDWRPLVESSRIHLTQSEPYLRSLIIDRPIWSDSGIYSCVALNDAGQAVTSCTITIEAAERDFVKDMKVRELKRTIRLDKGGPKLREIYDIQEATEDDEAEYSESGTPTVNGTIANGVHQNPTNGV